MIQWLKAWALIGLPVTEVIKKTIKWYTAIDPNIIGFVTKFMVEEWEDSYFR